MIAQRLEEQLEEERKLCRTYGRDPMDSPRYRSIQRLLLVHRENSNPSVRRAKAALGSVLIIAIPITIWMWAYVISETIKIIIK